MTGFVYFLRCGDFVKIGYSKVPNVRIRHLRTATPYQVEIIGMLPGTRKHEGALHRYFADVRHTKRHEWFRLTDGIRDVAKNGYPDNIELIRPLDICQDDDAAALIGKAIERFGSEAAAARAAGVSQPYLHEARKSGRCGPKLAMGLERATDGEISRSDLRPDLWPAPPASEGEAA